MELSKYEIEVLKLLLDNNFSKEEINTILQSPITSYDYTGVGYFLELTNSILPNNRMVLSEPTITGKADEFDVGFVIFIENKTLVLECHSWGGDEKPPETVREMALKILVK